VHRGKGVLFLYGNYAGDNMNFDMAAELLVEDEGIEVRTVRVTRRCRRRAAGSHARPPRHRRRCLRHQGDRRRRDRTRQDWTRSNASPARPSPISARWASRSPPARIPETGKLTFELADDEIEIGMGAHGEAGV
jgi:dihydroxyacetone kinase-like protein